MKKVVFCFLALFCLSCSKNEDYYRQKGERLSKKIALELEQINSAKELKEKAPLLRKKALKLTDLMIKAESIKSTLEGREVTSQTVSSDQLLYELNRLAQDKECLKLLKDIQRDALEKLDAYDAKKQKDSKS